jgi:hypothetical protein
MGCSLRVTAPQEQHVHTHEHAVLTAHDPTGSPNCSTTSRSSARQFTRRALQPNKRAQSRQELRVVATPTVPCVTPKVQSVRRRKLERLIVPELRPMPPF